MLGIRAREAHMKVSPSDFQDLALKYLLFRPYLALTSAKYAPKVLPVQKTLNLGVLLRFNEKVKNSHGQFSRSTFRNPPLKYPLHRETPIRASRGLGDIDFPSRSVYSNLLCSARTST